MYQGQCLCGAIKISIRGPIEQRIHCYCSMCQTVHGSDHSEWGTCLRSDIDLYAEPGALAEYESSAGVFRRFCSHCGAHVQWADDSEFNKSHFSFSFALLKNPPTGLPLVEYFKPTSTE